jgi:hypothetical protein
MSAAAPFPPCDFAGEPLAVFLADVFAPVVLFAVGGLLGATDGTPPTCSLYPCLAPKSSMNS